MSITKKQFLEDVKTELLNLKNNTTVEEKSKLLNYINGNVKHKCVYGQLTGSCESKRAMELMNKCCVRVVRGELGEESIGLICGLFSDRTNETFSDIKKFINGGYTNDKVFPNGEREYNYYSALETYILLKDAKLNNILNFLKGNTEKIEL